MYCNKCGEKIIDSSKPCPTCGLVLDNSNNFISINGKSYFFPLIVFVVVFFGCGLLLVQKSFSSILINHNASNYSLTYDNIVWTEYEVGEGVYALVNNGDKETYLQFPTEAEELGLTLKNEESLKTLYDAYVISLSNAVKLDYNNISSSINRLEGTDYFYLTADYVSYDNTSQGKLYVVLNEEGKSLNILLTLGNNSIVDLEDDVYDILKSIEM